MTNANFQRRIPGIINHKANGYGELEILVDNEEEKGACYRHKDNTASLGTFGKSWFEVYEKLHQQLLSEGYITSL